MANHFVAESRREHQHELETLNKQLTESQQKAAAAEKKAAAAAAPPAAPGIYLPSIPSIHRCLAMCVRGRESRCMPWLHHCIQGLGGARLVVCQYSFAEAMWE